MQQAQRVGRSKLDEWTRKAHAALEELERCVRGASCSVVTSRSPPTARPGRGSAQPTLCVVFARRWKSFCKTMLDFAFCLSFVCVYSFAISSQQQCTGGSPMCSVHGTPSPIIIYHSLNKTLTDGRLQQPQH